MASKTTTQKIVIDINSAPASASIKQLQGEYRKINNELRETQEGSERYNYLLDQLAQRKSIIEDHNAKVRESVKAYREFTAETRQTGGGFESLRNKFSDFASDLLSGNISIRGAISSMVTESKAALASIPVVGWLAAVAAGIGLAVREIVQYNTELNEANKLTASITKLQGDALDEITLRSRAMEDAFGFGRKETLEAAKALVNEFKISYTEALDEIEKGAIKGGNTNTEYLESIREYPAFFAKAGFAVQDFIAIVNAGYDLGIYNDKLPDAIKEFNISVTEQTKSSRDALVNAFGATFADELLKNVNTGKMTVKDALTEIAAESGKYNLTQKQQAQLTADLFRGAGEDAGGFLAIMKAVNVAAEDLNRPLTETEELLKKQADKYNELETAKYEAMESDSVMALKREFDMLWKNLQIGYYNFISWIRQADREFKASGVYMGALFSALPGAATKSFRGIMDSFSVLISGLQAGGKAISSFFAGDFDQAEQEFERFKNKYKQFETDINKSVNNFGKDVGKAASDAANKFRSGFDAETKAKGEAERKRLAAEAAKNANNYDGSEGKGAAAKKSADAAAKKAEAERKRLEAERKKEAEARLKDLEESLKAEAEPNNRSLELEIQFRIDKVKLQEDSREKELALADLERSKEFDGQRKQQDEILKNIRAFEEKIANAKSREAKANFEKALKEQRKILETHDQIVLISEQAYQVKVKAIRDKWSAKDFEDFVKAEQRKIEEGRRLDEDGINSISTMEEAKLALSTMKHLKLTDQELSGISSLEDAKRALREDADRKALAANLVALEAQKAVLTEMLNDPALKGEALDQLKDRLVQINGLITSVKGSIANGTENDAKKVTEENKQSRGAVDLLGFSVLDWENMYNNLDTTKGKIQGVIMIMQALSEASKMFNEMQKASAERDLRRFEQIQNKKKESLLNQLNTGYITNEQYNKEIQKMEAETAYKKAEIAYKTAKAEKAANIMSAIAGTATAVVGALGNKPWTPLNFVLAGLVGALGAVQVGMIAAQPLPERPSFAGGGFTGSGFGDPDNSGFKPAGIVHEGEWVAPEWMTENPRTAKVIDYLESVRLGKTTAMAEGGFAAESSKNTSNDTPVIYQNNNDSALLPVLYRLGNFLEYLITKGVYIEKNAKNGKEAEEMIEEWRELKNKNKH